MSAKDMTIKDAKSELDRLGVKIRSIGPAEYQAAMRGFKFISDSVADCVETAREYANAK